MSMSDKIPNVYPNLKKGDRLYAVITYHTPNVFVGHYVPWPYFVLEVHIEQVSDGAPGGMRYFFDTQFYLAPSLVYKELDNAKNALVKIFIEETDGILTRDKVRLMSAQEYREGAHKNDRQNKVA